MKKGLVVITSTVGLAYALLLTLQVSGQVIMDRNSLDGKYAPLIELGLEIVEFTAPVGDRRVKATIASPPPRELHSDPVLLLTVGGPNSHILPPNTLPAEFFWKQGHRVVSFEVGSMPGSLELYRDTVLAGPDPTLTFIAEARAVLKEGVDQKWARPGRIVVTGISRYAYLAMRLMAADDTLRVGGGFAPVTDWRDLSEFHDQREMDVVADMRLSLFADSLTGKKIYLAIGNHDERVNTLSCVQFFLDLNAANKKRGFEETLVDLFVTPDVGHTCGDEWYLRGLEILLNEARSADAK